jgi:hypothetical protein
MSIVIHGRNREILFFPSALNTGNDDDNKNNTVIERRNLKENVVLENFISQHTKDSATENCKTK